MAKLAFYGKSEKIGMAAAILRPLLVSAPDPLSTKNYAPKFKWSIPKNNPGKKPSFSRTQNFSHRIMITSKVVIYAFGARMKPVVG